MNCFCRWRSLRNCCIQCGTTCWIHLSQQQLFKTQNHWCHNHPCLSLTLLFLLCDPFLLLPGAQLYNYTTGRGLKDTCFNKQDAYQGVGLKTLTHICTFILVRTLIHIKHFLAPNLNRHTYMLNLNPFPDLNLKLILTLTPKPSFNPSYKHTNQNV